MSTEDPDAVSKYAPDDLTVTAQEVADAPSQVTIRLSDYGLPPQKG